MMPARDDGMAFGAADLMVKKRARKASGHRLVVIGMDWTERRADEM